MRKAEKYLNRVEWLDRHIRQKIDELTCINSIAENLQGATVSITKVKTQLKHDKFEKSMSKLVDLSNEISAAIEEYADLKREVSRRIDMLDNPQQEALLRGKYINLKTYEQLGESLNRSRNWAYVNNQKAVAAFAKKYF